MKFFGLLLSVIVVSALGYWALPVYAGDATDCISVDWNDDDYTFTNNCDRYVDVYYCYSEYIPGSSVSCRDVNWDDEQGIRCSNCAFAGIALIPNGGGSIANFPMEIEHWACDYQSEGGLSKSLLRAKWSGRSVKYRCRD